jgi:hypothetical protein
MTNVIVAHLSVGDFGRTRDRWVPSRDVLPQATSPLGVAMEIDTQLASGDLTNDPLIFVR